MDKTFVADGETPQALSARLCRPLCMLLRANRLYSASWLLPGREIDVPAAGFCEADAFSCPARAMKLPAEARRLYIVRAGDTARSVGRAHGLPARAVYAHAGLSGGELAEGRALCLPEVPPGTRVRTVRPGESLSQVAPEARIARLRALNALWGCAYPGMKLAIPPEAESF